LNKIHDAFSPALQLSTKAIDASCFKALGLMVMTPNICCSCNHANKNQQQGHTNNLFVGKELKKNCLHPQPHSITLTGNQQEA